MGLQGRRLIVHSRFEVLNHFGVKGLHADPNGIRWAIKRIPLGYFGVGMSLFGHQSAPQEDLGEKKGLGSAKILSLDVERFAFVANIVVISR